MTVAAECAAGLRPGIAATPASITTPAATHFHLVVSHTLTSDRGGGINDDNKPLESIRPRLAHSGTATARVDHITVVTATRATANT